MLLTHPDSPKYDLRGLVYISGGAPTPKGLYEEAKKRGIRVVTGYGMTETAPVLTVATVP
jgi:fatty-acyl-CoA synthase